ncbi:MAG: preprotein translocase subunit SecG [Clostridiales bacterium]|nr:preprotein translocase subunit SecG [Clostridiales bacterium]
MLNVMNILAENVFDGTGTAYKVVAGILLGLIALFALLSLIFVLMQPSNSSGIDALGGSSETFFGKNKGKSIEAKMKKWTWICLICLGICAILFYVILKLDIFFS